MDTMHLLRITVKDLGSIAYMIPSVPESRIDGEDGQIPRVCAALTLPGCLSSTWLYGESVFEPNQEIDFYLYCADIPVDAITQPNTTLVPDAWLTGELWVTKPFMWTRLGKYTLRKGKDITIDDNLCRYNVFKDGNTQVEYTPFATDGSELSYTTVETNFHFTKDFTKK